jgi:hypothetical protein
VSVTITPRLKTCRPMSRAAIEAEAGAGQNGRMIIVSGKVVDGRDAIARCERGETVPIRAAPWRASLSPVSEPLTVEVSALAASKVHAAETW